MVAFTSSTVLTAAALNSAFNAFTVNTQTSSYTLVLGDAGNLVTMSNAAANQLTIPPNASVAFATGTHVSVVNLGAGACTITPGAGVTVNGSAILSTNDGASLIKTGTNTWSVVRGGGLPKAFVSGTPTGSPATGSYTDANNVTWDYYSWTTAGTYSITFATGGWGKVLVVGGGEGAGGSWAGGAGGVREGAFYLSGTLAPVVGAAGGSSGADGGTSSLGSLISTGGGGAGNAAGTGTGDGTGNLRGAGVANAGYTSSITGSAVEYGKGGIWAGTMPSPTPGSGGSTGGTAAQAGAVIIAIPR